MSLSLHTIQKDKKIIKKRKRIGRGNASGHGTYSGKGQKGQKCRSGISKLKLKKIGMKRGRSALRGVPKLRGFKSNRQKAQVVNLVDINKKFKDNEIVNPSTLLKSGLISKIRIPVKILGTGDLKIKVIFKGVSMSKTVVEKIKK